MPPKTTPALEIAKALGLDVDQTADLVTYDEACTEILDLLDGSKGLHFPRGEHKINTNWSDTLARRASELRPRLKKAVDEAKDILSKEGATKAKDHITAKEVTDLVAAYKKLITTDLDNLTKAVQKERSAKAQALAMIDRAAWLHAEREKLSPGAPVLETAGVDLTKARAFAAELDFHRALAQATKAVEALERVPDAVRDLKETDGDAELVREIKTLRTIVLSSPLDDLAKTKVLEFVLAAVEEIKTPDNVDKAKEAVEEAEVAYTVAMANLGTHRAKYLGLLDTGKSTLNRLVPVGDTAKVLEYRVQLDQFVGQSLNPTAERVKELGALVETMTKAYDAAVASYEAVAANLKKLDGYEPAINALLDDAKGFATSGYAFTFPVDPRDLLSDFRALTDKVHNRTSTATEVETVVQQLIDGKLEDTAAVTDFKGLLTDIGTEVGKVETAKKKVDQALDFVGKQLETKGVKVEEMSSPPKGSMQDYQRQLASLMEGWKTTVANCWKTKSIDSADTVEALGELQEKVEGINPKELVFETGIATAKAAYRKAHAAAMEQLGKAVLVQRKDDKQPAEALGAITKIEQRFLATDDQEEIEKLTEDQERQEDLLKRYIISQDGKLIALQQSIETKLDEATDLLEAVVKAKKGGKSKKVRKGEQQYAQWVIDNQIPELALFVEATLFSVLDDALERADKVLRDAKSIHAVVVDGGSASFHGGVTFDEVTTKIEQVRVLLKNKQLGTHRKAAKQTFIETWNDIKDKAFSRPASESIDDLDNLLAADGIPKAINEAVLDGKNKSKFKTNVKELRALLKKQKKKFTGKFTREDMVKANKAGTAAPSAPDGTGYLQDLLDRIKGLETMVKKEEGVVSDCLDKLETIKTEAEEAIDDPLKIIKAVRGIQDTDEARETNRAQFDKEWKEHHDQAMHDLEKDKAKKADRKKHKAEVERDFKLARQVFEASGKIEDARHMLLNGAEKAAFYGLGGAETKARYARKDLEKHQGDWRTNVATFNGAVHTALDNAVKAVEKADNMDLSDKGKTHVAEVRGRLTRLFDAKAFDEAITLLSGLSSSDDKTKARAVRERGLQTCRTYLDLVDNDPDILLLDMSPAGGFAHASALLKRTLMMLERTMLVSVPHGE